MKINFEKNYGILLSRKRCTLRAVFFGSRLPIQAGRDYLSRRVETIYPVGLRLPIQTGRDYLSRRVETTYPDGLGTPTILSTRTTVVCVYTTLITCQTKMFGHVDPNLRVPYQKRLSCKPVYNKRIIVLHTTVLPL